MAWMSESWLDEMGWGNSYFLTCGRVVLQLTGLLAGTNIGVIFLWLMAITQHYYVSPTFEKARAYLWLHNDLHSHLSRLLPPTGQPSPSTIMPSAGVTMAVIVLIGATGAIVGYLATEERRRLEESESTPEWTYHTTEEGETPYGPEYWGEAFPDCYGDSQSPINLSESHHVVKHASEYDLVFHPTECPSTEMHFSPGEHQWMVDFTECEDRPSLEFDGDHYQLVNVHIHSVSEHENGGSCHDAEIHMVHVREGSTDDLLVVGVLLDAGAYGMNNKLTDLWTILEKGEEDVGDEDEDFVSNPYELLPSGPEYAHYMGSLTTPPCTEGVKWLVMTDITMLSLEQLNTFRSAVGEHTMINAKGHTNRPVQPLNGREVHYVTSY